MTPLPQLDATTPLKRLRKSPRKAMKSLKSLIGICWSYTGRTNGSNDQYTHDPVVPGECKPGETLQTDSGSVLD